MQDPEISARSDADFEAWLNEAVEDIGRLFRFHTRRMIALMFLVTAVWAIGYTLAVRL